MPQNDPSSTKRKLVNTYIISYQPAPPTNKDGFRSILRTAAVLTSMFMCLTAMASNTIGQEQTNAAPKVANLTTEDRLRKTVTHLSETIGERNLTKPKKLDETVEYLQREFESVGYKITKQTFQVNGIDCHNLIAEVIGTDKPDEIVIVGAHYDSAQGTPGANDNGSGVAALLEIARQMHVKRYPRTVRFVAFANEEPPYFQRDGKMGSWVYAKACRQRNDNIKVVLSLETMGYFTDTPNGQKYPAFLAPFYPSTGNFIGLVSNIPSRKLLDQVTEKLKSHCKVDVQKGALQDELPGVGWSDHWSFWQEGYLGIMVTDTALFRYPHYHQPEDTVDKLAFGPYSQVVDGLAKTIADLASESNMIVAENAKPGATDWQLTRVRVDGQKYRSPWIEGYCSSQSVRAGETIDIKVSANPARSFNLEIFRTGYYGGAGARLMKSIGPLEATTQATPTPGEKDLHECKWSTTHSLKIPKDWQSGVYLGRLTTIPANASEPYWQSYVIFVVTDDRKCDVLFQCSDNTWQAYNQWPSHYSVYTHPKGNQGPWADVSFDRPYGREAQFDSVVNDPLTVGAGEFLPLEFPLAYWLEQNGYDVSYVCNSDMVSPARGLKSKVFISVGHDEYWDIRQFRSVEKMRDEGVSLMFLSGNSVCWVTPMRASFDHRPNRIMFRGGPYGGDRQVAKDRNKQNGPFPELGPDEGLLMGARNVEPVNGGGDWICTNSKHWIFEGTGMKDGDKIPGLIGWEYHGDPADIPGLEIVGAGTAWVGGEKPQQWTATIYQGPKGNTVFNASSIFWVQGLSSPPGHTLPWSHWSRPHGPDARVQRITKNVIDRAIVGKK